MISQFDAAAQTDTLAADAFDDVDRAQLECPYPGLRPFTEMEESAYFGREAQRDECVRRLQLHRFLAVVGSSGSGKSSLVRAGLIPALSKGLLRGADERWRFILLRPGPEPNSALAQAVCQLSVATEVLDVERDIQASSRGLADEIAKRVGSSDHVLLIVDQFEEIFRLGKEQQTPERWHLERVAFIQSLLGARDAGIYVVITMRTDFLEDCTFFPDLPEALNAGQYLVPELTRADLERAIVEPAKLLGVGMSPALVRAVLNDAVQLRDSLPVVQHALMRTWTHWQSLVRVTEAKSDLIELHHYKDIGTAHRALDRHGDQLLDALGDDLVPVAQLLFQRLTLTNADGKVTRSPISFESLVQIVGARGISDPETGVRRVINAFRDEKSRFLMPPATEQLTAAEVDISHEAVFRVWKKLAGDGQGQIGWIAEEHRNGRMYGRLLEAARLKRDGSGQFLDDEHLIFMQTWWSRFAPNVEWGTRYHVLDGDAEAIRVTARSEYIDIDRSKHTNKTELRRAVHARYRAKLDEWHRSQFRLAMDYLDESVSVKNAKVSAQRKARLYKWILPAVTAGVGVGAVLLMQRLDLITAAVEIKSAAFEISRLETQRAELDKKVDDSQSKFTQSQESLRVTEAQLSSANDAVKKAKSDAAQAAQAAERKATELAQTNKELDSKRNELKQVIVQRNSRMEQIRPLEVKLEECKEQLAKRTSRAPAAAAWPSKESAF